MIIESISHRIPSLELTNEDLLLRVREANTEIPEARVEEYCGQLSALLRRAGACTRYVRDRASGETAQALILDAIANALAAGNVAREEIDLVIYCGVGRGFLEPANGAFLCQALGLSCEFFDISDACMSWVRSLHVAYSFLANHTYRTILVVNGEFSAHEYGIPGVFQITSPNQLAYTFPAYTIGEAATATVLRASPASWKFRFRSYPEMADLCTLPLPGYLDFGPPSDRVGRNGILRLTSFGKELTIGAFEKLIDFVKSTYDEQELEAVDIWFPHAASASLVQMAAAHLGLGSRVYSKIFPKYGNLVSASIPAALSLALRENLVRRGSNMVFCPASAGLSLALVEGKF